MSHTPPADPHTAADYYDDRPPAPVARLAPPRIVLTVTEAADQLGIGRTLMYSLVSTGAVESVNIGRLRRIPLDALATYVDSLRMAGNSGVAA